jgi:antitoxin MazE
MFKTLTAIGNSLGLIIEKPILDLLKIDRNTPLEVTTDGKGLYIRPVESEGDQAAFVESARRMMQVHEETFRKLAE